MATVKVGSARIDERGKASGGKAGDNTGREVSTQNWYRHSPDWGVCIRALDRSFAKHLAYAMSKACANNKIGYDQGQRLTLLTQAKKVGYDPSLVSVACETDCSALVRVCHLYACAMMGLDTAKYDPGNFRTATEQAAFKKTGLYEILTDSTHTKQSAYLAEGDILCTPAGKSGHTVIVLNSGSKCDAKNKAPMVGMVKVIGANVYVRSAPDGGARALGIAHRGDLLKYQGEDSEAGWHLVEYKNQNGWISGKANLTEVI